MLIANTVRSLAKLTQNKPMQAGGWAATDGPRVFAGTGSLSKVLRAAGFQVSPWIITLLRPRYHSLKWTCRRQRGKVLFSLGFRSQPPAVAQQCTPAGLAVFYSQVMCRLPDCSPPTLFKLQCGVLSNTFLLPLSIPRGYTRGMPWSFSLQRIRSFGRFGIRLPQYRSTPVCTEAVGRRWLVFEPQRVCVISWPSLATLVVLMTLGNISGRPQKGLCNLFRGRLPLNCYRTA